MWVSVSKRMIDTAPKSLRAYSPARSAPPVAATRTWRSVTVRNTRSGRRPSDRATSSNPGSARRRAASTGRYT